MKLEQSFEVAAPPERVWEALIDVERVAPCLPGASVTGHNDDGSYNGEFKVKIGPTSASYSGKLRMEDVDAGAQRATMQAAGTDKRGQGGAKATIVSAVSAAGDGASTVHVDTDYHITGRLARFGRGGMIEEISARLLGEFAANLQEMLAGEGTGESPAPPPADPEPVVDPDAAIEGATPVADAAPPPAEDPAPEPQPQPQQRPAAEPLDAGSLVGGALTARIKANPVPLAALLVGFLVALGVLRRRG